MITQNIDLNMIPDSSPVVVHVNQYDVGEGRIVASLYNGAQAYTPASGATAVIQGMKPDGKGFDYNATLSGSTVTANVTEQMTAVEGKTRCQIVITEGNNVTGTFVFYLMVQKSALPADADMSRSEYDVVMQLIEQAEAISTNVPYIGANGNWWVWSVQEEAYVDSGVDASISVDIADITMIEPSATPYVTNTGTDTDPVFHLFIPRGKGISSITKTGTQGLVDTYTITYSDGATTTFTVTNGADGAQGPTGPQGATGPQGPKGDKGDKGDTGTTDAEILIRDTVGWTGKNLLGAYYGKAWQFNTGILVVSDNAISSQKLPVKNGDKFIATKKTALASDQNMVVRLYDTSGNYSGSATILANSALSAEYTVPSNVGFIGVTQFVGTGEGTKATQDTNEIMLRKADLTDPTYEPYHETVEQCKFDRAEQRVLGAKNFFNAYNPSTASGITVTDNGKSINLLWTTPVAWINRQWDVYLPKNTDFILYTRAEKTVGKSGVTVRAQDKSTQIYNAGTSDDAVKVYEFKFNSGDNEFVNIVLNASTGTPEAGNVTYKDFMIRLASDPDDTYAPYAMTNRELTESAVVLEADIDTSFTKAANNYVKKQGNVVNGMIDFNGVTTPSADTVIGTIPSGFRPSKMFNGVGYNASDTSQFLAFYIGSDGKITLARAISDASIRMPFTYII